MMDTSIKLRNIYGFNSEVLRMQQHLEAPYCFDFVSFCKSLNGFRFVFDWFNFLLSPSLSIRSLSLSFTLMYHELSRLFYVHYQESDTYLNRIAISFPSDVWVALFTNERTSVFLMLVDFLSKVLNHVDGAFLYSDRSQAFAKWTLASPPITCRLSFCIKFVARAPN